MKEEKKPDPRTEPGQPTKPTKPEATQASEKPASKAHESRKSPEAPETPEAPEAPKNPNKHKNPKKTRSQNAHRAHFIVSAEYGGIWEDAQYIKKVGSKHLVRLLGCGLTVMVDRVMFPYPTNNS